MISGEIDGEFRYLFIDMFCNLIDAGLQIKYVWEDERNLLDKTITEGEALHSEGSYENSFFVVQRYIQILSSKSL